MILPEELIEYSKKVCAKTAQLIADEMKETAQFAITEFYNNYTPKYYRRHNDREPYNFPKLSYQRVYDNRHSKKFIGGIELTPERMKDIYQDSTQEVFDSVYAGFHGVSSMFVSPKSFSVTPVMTPSPMMIIREKHEKIKNNLDEYLKNAQKFI